MVRFKVVLPHFTIKTPSLIAKGVTHCLLPIFSSCYLSQKAGK